MDVTIRPAREDDAEALTVLAMISKQSNGYDDAFMTACAEELRVTPALLAEHDHWVAESNIPCGFVSLHVDPEGNTGEVAALFIHPDWQRCGVGRRLWTALESTAREKGLTALHLDADPRAEAFYSGLGFITVRRVPSGSIPNRTLPHMRIELPV
ncbi:MAG: GNAT family N-acetyltransferase [Paracoccaceae bacterium]